MDDMDFKYDWDEEEEASPFSGGDLDISKVGWPLWLQAAVIHAEMKENSKETGYNLSVRYALETPGPWCGTWVFQTFVFTHTVSEKAQAIGRSKIGRLCRSSGFPKGRVLDELPDYAKSLDVKVDVEHSKGYADKLTVVDWAPMGTKVDMPACEAAARRYAAQEPAPAGSHRYGVDTRPDGKPDPTTVGDEPVEDDVPF